MNLIDKTKLAEKLNISVVTVNRELAKGLPSYKVGGQVRFDFDEVKEYYRKKK